MSYTSEIENEANADDYGYVINGPNTYRNIAADLLVRWDSVAINWTDGAGSAHSLLFAIPTKFRPEDHSAVGISWGRLHPAVPPKRALVVSIIGIGAAAFPLYQHGFLPMHVSYIGEKLFGLPRDDPEGSREYGSTVRAATDLINGVMSAIENGDDGA